MKTIPTELNSARRRAPLVGSLLLAALLVGCASAGHRAPIEDRATPPRGANAVPPAGGAAAAAVPAAAASAADPAKVLPGAENLGKPGYYAVRPGDTMIRIGLENGQNWRDIARWNGLDNPNVLEVGQVLRVVPPAAPAADPNAVVVRPISPGGRVDGKPLVAGAGGASGAAAAPGTPATPATSAAMPATAGAAGSAVAAAPQPATPAPAVGGDDDLAWSWPASGPVATGFDEVKSKGLAITGKVGDPVLATADGRVVYAGSGLRGYGNLIIVKHNATYLSAYAHNQTLLVKEDQVVRRGQKIAEMGNSDADRVQLHFEIRRQGKPVDPAKLLPPR
ncbi:peptidoglycan DD-metalloendopeptidase family protein [Rubrivivax sp. RP6-9]|uniref:peptidoglycan DD-metalloendopeptidase family protein n=1 Tax=Rubrivivax sp. RP6-9 TaxID=3415750 RepID=UPI003CC5E8BE